MNSSTSKFAISTIKLSLLLLGLLSFSACTKKSKPSVIVLAIDRLSFNAFTCSDEHPNEPSGMGTLCQESIRYTNVYTTSLQSAAAVGSLLSGTYPFQNGLHKNSGRISPQVAQVQELFKKNGYRTAFFSSNPSIMRRTGLSRGFDFFDDASFLNQPNYTTSFSDQVKAFKGWIEESSDPYFSVIYSSDLEVLGDDDTNQAKFEAFDGKLGRFIKDLKAAGQWENNFVMLIGLQGRSTYNRLGETAFSNVHSENMNIAFFIKPPRQKGDEGINLKINSLSSITDIGLSLMRLADSTYPQPRNLKFDVRDFSELWRTNKLENISPPTVEPPRQIVLEAANPWSRILELRFGIISGNYIYIGGEKNTLYNRLWDGLETIDLSKSESSLNAEMKNLVDKLHFETNTSPWTNFQPRASKFVDLNREYWSAPNDRDRIFENEKVRLTKEKDTHPLSTLLVYYSNLKKEKDGVYEEARRISYNLALENIWNLWNPEKKWPQPSLTTENQ